MTTKFEQELQSLKTWDEVQSTETLRNGYDFIATAGHGYLVVKRGDKHFRLAKSICNYGFVGKLAIYLEEDCEAGEFLRKAGL